MEYQGKHKTKNKIIIKMEIEIDNGNTTSDPTNLYYWKKENKRLIRVYGNIVYKNCKFVDLQICFPDPLKNHSIDSNFRTKLVDWIFEVINAFGFNEMTTFLTIFIIDAYLYKTKKKLKNEDLHIIGVTSLFIASKYEEVTPIHMHDLIEKICHNRFSENDIKKKEREILENLEYQIIIHSVGDFLKNHFCEFRITNKQIIDSNIENYFKSMEQISVYISKVILHSDAFSLYKNSIKAIACIVISFEILRSQITISKENEKIIKEWILLLMDDSEYNPDDINNLYNKIADYYAEFQQLKISHNLIKTSKLPF